LQFPLKVSCTRFSAWTRAPNKPWTMNFADPVKLPKNYHTNPSPNRVEAGHNERPGCEKRARSAAPRLSSESIVRTMLHVKHSEREPPRAAWISYFSVRSAPPFCAAKSSRTTTPPFITNLTRCISVISCSGSPETAIRSAYLPFSIVPMVSSL
jgi:hypothetical protein